MNKHSCFFRIMSVLCIFILSLINIGFAFIFPMSEYQVSRLALPWLNDSAKTAFWVYDDHIDHEYYADETDAKPYYDYLAAMGNDEMMDYVICNNQSIYPDSDNVGNVIRGIIMNQTAHEYFPYRISEGRDFDEHDYIREGNEQIPILIGADLHQVLSVNDSFTASFFCTERTFCVVGVLEEGTTLYQLDTQVLMDDRVLIPAFLPLVNTNSFFDKAIIQSYLGAVVITSGARFTDIYERLWNLSSRLGIRMTNFGRISPVMQMCCWFRMKTGLFGSWCLSLLFACSRIVLFAILLKEWKKKCGRKLVIIPICDIALFLFCFKLFFAPEFSYVLPWQYLMLEVLVCLLLCRRKQNEKVM